MPGCSSSTPDTAAPESFAFDKDATNIALLFGSPNDLRGVTPDVNKSTALFQDASLNLGFKVVAKNFATKDDILNYTKQHAPQISANGTLLWYFSGHGLDNGKMFTQDKRGLLFKEVSDAILSVRTTPIKRLIVIIDNCFSGVNLEGQNAIIPPSAGGQIAATPPSADGQSAIVQPSADGEAVIFPPDVEGQAVIFQPSVDGQNTFIPTSEGFMLAEQISNHEVELKNITANNIESAFVPVAGSPGQLYEQALVLVASRANELSGDTANGGVFSEAWRQVMRSLRQSGRKATLRDLVEQTTALTAQNSQYSHTPVYRAFPSELVLNDWLYEGSNQAIPVTGNTNGITPDSQNPAIPTTGSSSGTGPSMLLGASFADATTPVYVAGPPSMDLVGLCRGTDAACRASPRSIMTFTVAPDKQINGMKVFKSTAGLQIVADQQYTLLIYDANKAFLGSSTVSFKKI